MTVVFAVAACSGESESSDSIARNAAGAEEDGSVADASEQQPTIVSMGDSYIAGTAGRWAGNSNGFSNLPRNMDAFTRSDTGANAYDNYGLPTLEFCFRSRSAPIHLGDPWRSINLACSGALTTTVQEDWMGLYKPGLDDVGQLPMLTETAADGSVALIAISMGANNFNFGPTVNACATAFLSSSSLFPRLCSKDAKVLAYSDDAAVARVRADLAAALERVVATMRGLGYDDASWDLVVHNYPVPLPPASKVRYQERGYSRQVDGGCPLYDADLDWFQTMMARYNSTVAEAVADARTSTGRSIAALDISTLFDGRRLCETGTKHVEETTDEESQRRFGERVAQIHLSSKLIGSPYDITEGVHPNYYGQLAIRACLRAAFNNGDATSGTCTAPTDWGVVNDLGEPSVVFVPA